MVEAESGKWLKMAENCRKHQFPINGQEFFEIPILKPKAETPLKGRIKLQKHKW